MFAKVFSHKRRVVKPRLYLECPNLQPQLDHLKGPQTEGWFCGLLTYGWKDPTLGEDDFKAMAIELVLVAALCAGVRAFCAAAGIPAPPLPPAPQPSQPGRFRFVSDYSTSSLKTHRSIAWGPHLPSEQLRKEVVEAFHLDPSMISFGDSPAIPTSRASAAPLTCWEFLQWRDVMYVPIHDVLRFMKVPGTDRTLNRGQLEVAAADYTTAKACNF